MRTIRDFILWMLGIEISYRNIDDLTNEWLKKLAKEGIELKGSESFRIESCNTRNHFIDLFVLEDFRIKYLVVDHNVIVREGVIL